MKHCVGAAASRSSRIVEGTSAGRLAAQHEAHGSWRWWWCVENHAGRRNRHSGLLPALLVLGLLSGGCRHELRPIFEEHRPPLEWPSEPAPPRIRYVGQLRSSDDLKPPPKPFQALGEFFVGAEQPEHIYGPRAVVCTPDGERVWIADPGGRCLHMFDLKQRRYLKITRAGDSPLLSPVGMCLGPMGSIYVCDSESVAIYRLSDRTGETLGTLGLAVELQRPVAIHYDSASDQLFVVDAVAHDVKVLTRDGTIRSIIGRRGDGAGEFNFPTDITGNDRMIWIVDTGNQRVQGLTQSGQPVVVVGQAGDAPGDLAWPKGVAVDTAGHIYVVDARFENVQIFDPSGRLLLFIGQEGNGPGEFWLPSGIFVGADNRIWVCDSYNRRVQVFEYLGSTNRQERTGD